MYTMMLAAMDRRVIAVDILQENIDHIKTSLQMMDKTDKVELVLNAISDGYETLYPKFEAEGGSSFVENERGNGGSTLQIDIFGLDFAWPLRY